MKQCKMNKKKKPNCTELISNCMCCWLTLLHTLQINERIKSNEKLFVFVFIFSDAYTSDCETVLSCTVTWLQGITALYNIYLPVILLLPFVDAAFLIIIIWQFFYSFPLASREWALSKRCIHRLYLCVNVRSCAHAT